MKIFKLVCTRYWTFLEHNSSQFYFLGQEAVGWWCCVQKLCSIRTREEQKHIYQRFASFRVPQKIYGEIRQINFILWLDDRLGYFFTDMMDL
jgi:hypothetical protein